MICKRFRPPERASERVIKVHIRFFVVRKPYPRTVAKEILLQIFLLLKCLIFQHYLVYPAEFTIVDLSRLGTLFSYIFSAKKRIKPAR